MIPVDLETTIAIAAAVLNARAGFIVRLTDIAMAESALAAPFASWDGIEFYDSIHEKAGVLCSRLIRNHPFPDGNKRTAYLAMLWLIEINGYDWNPPTEQERGDAVEMLAARAITEPEFIDWVSAYITPKVTG